jgi:hypothetical protein
MVERIMRERPVSVTLFGMLNIGFGLFGLAGVLLSILFVGIGSPGAPVAGASSGSIISMWPALLNAITSDAAYMALRQISVRMEAACGVALLAAGIGLLALKNWSRRLSIGWAIYRCVLAFIESAVMFMVVRRVLGGFPQVSQEAFVMAAGVAIIEVVFALIYPLLLLYFMTRPRVVQAFQPASPV